MQILMENMTLESPVRPNVALPYDLKCASSQAMRAGRCVMRELSIGQVARAAGIAARKLPQLEQTIARTQQMKQLLESSFHCRCQSLADCERYLSAARRRRPQKAAPRPCAP